MTTAYTFFATLACAMVALLATSLPAGADEPYFMGLGWFPGARHYSVAKDVSADGSTVVGFANYGGIFGFQAFRWTADEGMVGLGVLPGRWSSRAFGVSADGSVIVGHSYPWTEAFRWTADAGMVGLGDLPGGELHSDADGLSADGSIVVGWSGSENATHTFEAFRWTAEEGLVGLGDLPGLDFFSQAFGISADGCVIVGMSIGENSHEAFRWTADEGMIGLGDLPGGGSYSQALAASLDGSVIVGAASPEQGGVEAFRWTEQEGMVGLGYLPGGYQSYACDVSADGAVAVGTSADDVHSYVAFIWDAEHGMRNLQDLLVNDYGLDLTGWRLSRARGISADGLTIVGSAYHPNGDVEAWIAHIPEPATVWPLTVAGLLLLHRRRRK